MSMTDLELLTAAEIADAIEARTAEVYALLGLVAEVMRRRNLRPIADTFSRIAMKDLLNLEVSSRTLVDALRYPTDPAP